MNVLLLKYILIFILLGLGIYFDIRYVKVKNSVTLPAMAVGLGVSFSFYGLKGLISSILGMILPIIILFFFFAARMLGSGDIKLFGAIGSIMGYQFVLYDMAYSFLFGGIIAIIVIVIRKNARERIQHLVQYIKTCFLTFKLYKYQSFDKKNTGIFRFAYAIALGTITLILMPSLLL